MRQLLVFVFLFQLMGTFVFPQAPLSKEATLIEAVSSSEWLLEATGKYMSPEKKERKAKKDVDKNGITKATDDAKKAVVYFVLFGGTDPLISTPQERQKFDQNEAFYFDMSNVSRYISWEESALQKKIKISGGKGLKIVKRFKINKTILKEKFLETSQIYKDTPGLIRKNYISDIENYIAGGVYCNDNMINAKKWFDDERIEWLANRYSKPDLKFYENPVIVDNNVNEIIS